ncbi:uncharacterized protein LOC110601091 [Manihot esculenta]|uniref:DUF4378 domain-containing protein n=1 Tax=Manihot esculenta TaxID=3983 RepID=A0A2C9UBM8_MANES|nr:uncharacterized protein LOC110601091 [Manihot esculenta]OAY27679.1 hypothetical protein MANES_15G006700v8 [Manihot esculenta]
MGVEKEVSKSGGGYVGGFFQLFDWTAKSRKKLFSSKSDLTVPSKQGKRSDGNLPMTRLHLMDEDENGAGSSIRGSSDYSCASSVIDDDGCGPKAPGVVARLMGLDSMPTSSFSEPNTTPFLDSQSLREVSQRRKHFEYYHDHQILYSGSLLNKEGGHLQNFLDSKPQRVLSRPIEKFQTEILPPKSAKSIPITHHKLLSPIKSPGFIPSKTAAHIMEAAARIIEPTPQTTAKAKISVVGSSSVPLKVRDLKEKLEVAQKMPLVGPSAASLKARELKQKVEAPSKTSRLAEPSRRPAESNAVKCLKGQSLNKSWNGSVEITSFGASPETQESSSGLKNKGKSISLAIQAKVNVQKRGSLNSSGSRGLLSQKDQCEVTSSQNFKGQLNIQKSLTKKSSMHNGVLRQNNQKQNCHIDKDKPAKATDSCLQGRKTMTGNSSYLGQKTSVKTVGSKTGSRKLGLDVTHDEKGLSNYSTKHISRKKRSIDGNLHTEKNRVVDNMFIDKNRKEIESNQGHFSWAEENKKGMDVVSFTFTAPLMRSTPGYETCGQFVHKDSNACMDNRGKRLLLDTDSGKLSSVGYNVIRGDALSTLLEQKLRELTNNVVSSSCNYVKKGSASSSLLFSQDPVPTLSAVSTTPMSHCNWDQNMLLVGKSGNSGDSDILFSTDTPALRLKHLFQGVDEREECSSKSNDCRKLLDCIRPSPVSVLEPSISTESSSSLDSTDCSSTEGSKQCSSIQAHEILGLSSSKKFQYMDADTDLSDSASSMSTGTAAGKHANTLPLIDLVKSIKWEREYVQKILFNLEFMFQDFAVGQAREIISPHLFNELESQLYGQDRDGVEARLERKVLFDCVNECLDIRCRRYVGGGYKTWTRGVTMVRRKERLAEEMLKEISAWEGMGDCMVDELVDKDMSSQYGKWMGFEVDAFFLGTEIEGRIFSSLLDEVVADVLRC